MRKRLQRTGVLFLGTLGLSGCRLAAQQSAPATTSPQGTDAKPYTLNVNSRLVFEDVSVTDRAGNPVRDLPQSAFHVTDNKVPQTILSFASGTEPAPAAAPSSPGTFTNTTLYRSSGTLVALLIDPVTLELQDQMYLRLQVQRFVDALAPDTPVAVFRTSSSGIPVLLQSPTTDKALLRDALGHSVPIMTRPVYSSYTNALLELANLADFFRAVPGKKAVLWLAGRFPLYEPPDFTLRSGGDRSVKEDQIRNADRALQQARVVVYPIDARGVLAGGLAPVKVIDTAAAANDPSTVGTPPLGDSRQISGQYERMDEVADATGGKAFYSTNAVATAMRTATTLATTAYTLVYRPSAVTGGNEAGSQHTVHITVDGPYTVHYREAYLAGSASGSNSHRQLAQDGPLSDPQPAAAIQAGSAALAERLSAPVDAADRPILFSAHVEPACQGRTTNCRIRYVIPESELSFGPTPSSGNARFRLAALAYNASGDVLSHAMDVVETHWNAQQLQLAARIGTPADQSLTIGKGAQYLLLAVEDLQTGRVGTLQISLASLHEADARH